MQKFKKEVPDFSDALAAALIRAEWLACKGDRLSDLEFRAYALFAKEVSIYETEGLLKLDQKKQVDRIQYYILSRLNRSL